MNGPNGETNSSKKRCKRSFRAGKTEKRQNVVEIRLAIYKRFLQKHFIVFSENLSLKTAFKHNHQFFIQPLTKFALFFESSLFNFYSGLKYMVG